MARGTHAVAEVRPADEHDLDVLCSLFAEVEGTQSALLRRGRNVPSARDDETTRDGFATALVDPFRRVVVADHAGDVCGFAVLSLAPASSLVPEPSVRIDPLVVARRARRRGVGRLLMGAAAGYAEEQGAVTLTVAVRPADRDANRHFSRLGFAPVEVRRVAPVAVVRRALALPRADAVSPPAVRRRLIARSHAGRP